MTLFVGRALTIFGICGVGRCLFPKSFDMPIKEQGVLYCGGVIRGAICWAQVIQVHHVHRHIMLSTTLAVILFTTLVFGSALPFILRTLNTMDDAQGTEWHPESPLRVVDSEQNIRATAGATAAEEEAELVPKINRVGSYRDGGDYESITGTYGSTDQGGVESEGSEGEGEPRGGGGENNNESFVRNFDDYVMKPFFGGKKRNSIPNTSSGDESRKSAGGSRSSRQHVFGHWAGGDVSPINETGSAVDGSFPDFEASPTGSPLRGGR